MISLYINNNQHIYAQRVSSNNNHGFVNIDTTWKLVKNDEVHVRFSGNLEGTSNERTTHFEGRMVALIDG